MNIDGICEFLNEKYPQMEIKKNEPMKAHTSFKIGGMADVFIKTNNIDEVRAVLEICDANNVPLYVIGNGSNLLVSDDGVRGVVLKICIDTIEIEKAEDKKEALVRVGSGVLLGKLAQILLKESIAGFEFASGIPGTIGGAISMNAGAYGTEFKDIVVETNVIDEKGNLVKLSNADQEFSYRSSIYKRKKYIVIDTLLKFTIANSQAVIKEKMDEYKRSRIEKQPLEFPSAGSTFKRGEDFITAKLIDECGLKGYKMGGAEVSTKHAGFIINSGNATCKDVLELVQYVKDTVYEKCGKKIELEIEVIK